MTVNTVPSGTVFTGTTVDAIRGSGAIKIGISTDSPGVGYLEPDTGLVSGIDAMVSRFIALQIFGGNLDDIDQHIDFIPVTASERMNTIMNGNVDLLIACLGITEERRKLIEIAGPYFGSSLQVIVSKYNNSINHPCDLDGQTIATVRGSVSAEWIKQHTTAMRVFCETVDDLYTAVTTGIADAAITANPVIQCRQGSLSEIRKLQCSLAYVPWGIGIRKGNTALRDFVSAQLPALAKEKSYADALWRTGSWPSNK